jgi:hypothetical protein
MPKEFWKSKTLWFNVLAFAFLVANGFGFADFVHDPQLAEYAAAVITIVNLLLRMATTKPITFGSLKNGAPKR